MVSELKKIQQQIAALQKKEADILNEEKASVIEILNGKIEEYNITPRELRFGGHNPRKQSKVAVKYKKGSHAWSGRGRKPQWVVDHLSGGGKIEDLLVK